MIYNIFSIYDTKGSVYSRPILSINEASFKRDAIDALCNPNTIYAKHPHDFHAFHLGTYDDATGKFTQFDSPQSLFGLHEIQHLAPEVSDV